VTTTNLRLQRDKLLLASIFVILSTSTILWTLRDRTPPGWDPSDHIRYAYDYYRLLAHADLAGFASEFFSAHHYYAPFVHLVSAGVFLVFGASRLTGIAVNLFSLAALLLSTAWMSRRLYADVPGEAAVAPSVGLSVLPALLASCYHFSAWLMHDAFLDFPLMAIVSVTFALLVRAEDFRVRRRALAFALAAGIGMLVKQTFAFFFILPGLFVMLQVLRTRDRRAILNFAVALMVLILIAAIWYGPHMHDVIAIYRENQRAAANENEAPLFTFDSNFFYVHALISMQMQVPLAVLFAAGLVYSLVRCRKQSVILYLWLLGGIATFALVANKDVRYTLPVLPAAALLSACWLREFKPRTGDVKRSIIKASTALKVALVAAIAAWAFVSFLNAQWPKAGWGTAIDTPRYRWMVFSRNYYGFDHRPLDDDWSVPEIVRIVSKLNSERSNPRNSSTTDTPSSITGAANDPPVLGVVVNLPYLNPSSVALYARLLAKQRAARPLIDVRWVVEPSMLDRIPECDYLLVRTGLDQADWVAAVEREVEQLIRDNPEQFIRVASFPTPINQAEAVVYSRQTR
jgi:4-amino-4-deoxy-L-arabinose transferase-like glycosyltransferase